MNIEQNGNTITLTRTYNAPKELVFSMFQNPHVAQWWGPQQWPVKVSNMDFRPGGSWHYNMVGPDGTIAWGKAFYEEIDEPNKIIFTDAFSDADGNVNDSLPKGKTTISFTSNDDATTTLTLHGVYQSEEERKKIVEMGMLEGMKDTWTQLETLLNQVQQ